MTSLSGQREHVYTFEFRVAFWLVAEFTMVTFILWNALPDYRRAVPILERTWPPILTSFAGMVFGKLS